MSEPQDPSLPVSALGDGRYLVTDGAQRHLAYAVRVGASTWVFLDGRVHVRADATGRRASAGDDELALSAPMPATVTRVIPLTSVCRYLERIGDHVKNLAEDIVYMVRAQDVRHRPLPPPAN